MSNSTVTENLSDYKDHKINLKLEPLIDEVIENIKAHSKSQSIDDTLNELMKCQEKLEITQDHFDPLEE